MGVWACGCVLRGGTSDAMGAKIRGKVKLFGRLSFSTGGSSRKGRGFRLDPPVGIISRTKSSKKPFFDCVRNPDMSVPVENGRFRLTNPTV